MGTDEPPSARLERELFVRARLARVAEPGLGLMAASLAEEVVFAPGAILFREGEPALDFYSFLRGDIEVASRGMAPAFLRNQTGVGLLDVLAEHPRKATVTAVTRVRALRVPGEQYIDFLEEHYELALGYALRASQEVHELSLALAPDGGFAPVDLPAGDGHMAHPGGSLNLVERIEVLRGSRIFRKATVQSLVRLALLATEIHLEAGETLFRRGGAAGKFHFVAQGVIEATHDSPRLIARFDGGDLVCGYGALGNADNQYVARALAPTVVFAYCEEDFFDVMEEHFDLTRSVLSAIAGDYTRLVLERERRLAAARAGQ